MISSTSMVAPNPDWYSPETGTYKSKHPSVDLPSDPFLDLVSFIFSKKHDGVLALTDSSSGYSISYPQLFPFINSMASTLHKLGISQGDVILILLPNSIYYPIIFLASLYLGAIVTTMNPLSSISEIKKQSSECNVVFAFTLPENFEKLKKLGIPSVTVPEILTPSCHIFSTDFDPIKRPVIRQKDTAAILYSSGTTGLSKGVILTHENFISMVELFVRFEATQYDYSSSSNVFLAVLPMFHVYGLSLFVMGLLSLGSSIVVMRKFNLDEVVEAIGLHRVTHFPVVPPILSALTNQAKKGFNGDSSLKSLKQVSCGAAPLSRKVIEEFVQFLPHVDFIQGYGMTESTAVGTRGFNTKEVWNFSSIGLLAPSMEAKIVDWNSGTFLPPGSCGELWLRGPAIMKGYLDNEEATRLTIDDEGWLHTGDIVYFDQDGYLYISDRLKEIIKYKGFQIAPADLEAVLISHPEILDVAVTAGMDEKCGEIPVAFVVKKPGSALSQESIIDFVAKQVAPYKKVRKVVFTQLIPKSPAGKILRRALKNCLASKL